MSNDTEGNRQFDVIYRVESSVIQLINDMGINLKDSGLILEGLCGAVAHTLDHAAELDSEEEIQFASNLVGSAVKKHIERVQMFKTKLSEEE